MKQRNCVGMSVSTTCIICALISPARHEDLTNRAIATNQVSEIM